MTKWEYSTLVMGTPGKEGRCWKMVARDPKTAVAGKRYGKAEKPCLVGRLWQGARLLESAAQEMDADGWELVSHSFSGLVFGFSGVAVFRRPSSNIEDGTA